jgi:high-affinity iron transporter
MGRWSRCDRSVGVRLGQRELRGRDIHVAGAFIIVLREVIEAGLIIGIVLAVSRAVPRREFYISGGIIVGLLGAALIAAVAGALSNALAGAGQEVFNASVLGIAVIMLGWHNVWMARHGRQISENVRQIGRDVAAGARSMMALAVVITVTVLREGSEIVLFLYGLVISSREAGAGLLLGGLLGLLAGASISALAYMGLAVIPPRYLFKITGVLIGFMAAGMAAQSIAFLEQANIVTHLGGTVWNTSWILSDNGITGRVLHTLIGYTGKPTQMQLLVYLATLGTIFGLKKLLSPPAGQKPKLATN